MADDVVITKNYLTKKELKSLERIVTMYLDYAEDQAERHIPMTMEDWKKRLDVFLQFNEREVLNNPGKVLTNQNLKNIKLYLNLILINF